MHDAISRSCPNPASGDFFFLTIFSGLKVGWNRFRAYFVCREEGALEKASFGRYFGSFHHFPSNRVQFHKIKLMLFLVNFTEKKKSESFRFYFS